VIFVNGLPLGAIELKNPADVDATVWDAVQQLENYQTLIPALFTYNAVLIASDGVQGRIGALGAGKEWFKPWRTISGREDAAPGLPELQVVLSGVFQPRRFLDLLHYFDRQPVLSERRNIVVIADEAHRSQYDFIDGLARHLHDALPNASFIGFTGTPIEKERRQYPRGLWRLH
jgi:type I site-specific restriction-modification system R (restriction) subunit